MNKSMNQERHVCPWWIGWLLASPLRRLTHEPKRILSPFVSDGMLVLEPGPGMGFFTMELARAVGARGRVIAVDIQEPMLASLARRMRKAGLEERVECRLAREDSLRIDDLRGTIDFVLAFAMVHEVPDAERFFSEIAAALKRGGRMLFAEPAGHVNEEGFRASFELAAAAGLHVVARTGDPPKPYCRARAAVNNKCRLPKEAASSKDQSLSCTAPPRWRDRRCWSCRTSGSRCR